ncbi:importin-alpha export receptor [Ceratobasidium sp. 394]|nr:importin-alpha export receptor [Ceratobasidium sp. 394]
MEVPQLLLGSLDPSTRQQAEKQLAQAATHAGFLPHLLGIVLDKAQRSEVRMAAAVYFKNAARRRWTDEHDEGPVPDTDKALLREQLVPAMLALSTSTADRTERLLRPQLADALAAIAAVDYPDRWPTLIAQLTSSLSESDLSVNVGVLEAAHAVCVPWKSQVRSDQLFATINSVVGVLGEPLLKMFKYVTDALLGPSGASLPVERQTVLAQTLHLLLCLYADLVDQDIPPIFEDSVPEFFGDSSGNDGVFLRILAWSPEALKGDPEDPAPTPVMKSHQVIFEIAELFVLKYNELFDARMPAFVQAVWQLIGSMDASVREDGVFAQSVRFLSVTVKSGLHTALFSQPATLEGLFSRIVLPAMALRPHEVEQFEDDPLEYIRRDLSLSGTSSGGGTSGSEMGRRGAATELLRALLGVGLEAQATQLAEDSVGRLMGMYNAREGGDDAWAHKDTAVYLLSAVAARGSTLQHGVTSTNLLVNVVQFFSDHVAGDLQAPLGSVHPILQVDAIRFVHMFRNQFTKDQLLPVLKLLVDHVRSENYVCSAYAAIAIERILFMKQGGKLLFAQADIHDFANDILVALFAKIESGGSPQKIAENDYLMKCVMRVIITARQTLTPNFVTILAKLVGILGIISSNPSNPNFNQYCFESVSALMRFVCASNPQAVAQFEEALFGPFTIIIQQDVDQFIPYVFQILAQMLEIHTTGVPPAYTSLLPIMFTPAVWQQRGNVPALVRLVKAFLTKDPASVDLRAVLAVVQQRLIPSRVNDVFGFELLEAIVANLGPDQLAPLFGGILVTVMNRLQANKTPAFSYGFMRFVCAAMAVQRDGLGPDFVIGAVETIQAGLWSQILTHVLLPEVPRTLARDNKLVSVGLTRMLVHSQQSVQPPAANAWPRALEAVIGLFGAPTLTKTKDEVQTSDDAVTAIDYEEQGVGYQAGFSRLAASEGDKTDLASYAPNPQEYLVQQMQTALQDASKPIRQLLSQVETAKLQQLQIAGLKL